MEATIQQESRIKIIDILRGFALLGIIMVHFTEQYYAGQVPEFHQDMAVKNLGDQIVKGLIGILVQGKFFMIFSFLFGLSFFIQFDKSDDSGRFIARFAWRLTALFLIGMLHHLHYRGDILTIYAVLGFALLFLNKLPDKPLLILSLVLVANLPSLGVRLYEAVVGTTNSMFNPDQKELLAYYDTVKSGSYIGILTANFFDFGGKFGFLIFSGRIYITTGLFLLGLYVGRKKFFESWQTQIPVIQRVLRTSLWTILGTVLFTIAFFGGAQAVKIEMSQSLQFAVGGLAFDIFNACLAMFYVSGLLLLYRQEKWRKALMPFYGVGRMGLTTYLMQSLVGVLIFFSFGLGWLGNYGALICLALGLAIFGAQIYFSHWWLSRFRYGFFEWLWRSATYFKWQPFLK